jgi:hypothetical protein
VGQKQLSIKVISAERIFCQKIFTPDVRSENR